jgi:hypothetical protein
MPSVSVCAISSGDVNTATFAAVACLIMPVCEVSSVDEGGGWKKRTLALPPEYYPSDYFTLAQTTSHNLGDPKYTNQKSQLTSPLHQRKRKERRNHTTHQTLSTLNPFSPVGMTANTASATSAARMSAEPNCLGARADLRARARVGSVSGVGRVVVDRAVCDHVL